MALDPDHEVFMQTGLWPKKPPRVVFKRAAIGEFAVYLLVLAAGYHAP